MKSMCMWWLSVFGRMQKFFPQYLKMATGKQRGAVVVSLPISTAASVKASIETDGDASRILQHIAFEEYFGDDSETLRTLVEQTGDDAQTLTMAILEARPQAGEYVVVCNIFTDDRASAAAVNWAVCRES